MPMQVPRTSLSAARVQACPLLILWPSAVTTLTPSAIFPTVCPWRCSIKPS